MSRKLRQSFRHMFFALFLAMAPSDVPDWRADPGMRTVAVLPIGDPVIPFRKH